jgi:hypothetical protein
MYEPQAGEEASSPAEPRYEIRDRAGLTLAAYKSERSAMAVLQALVALSQGSEDDLVAVAVRADPSGDQQVAHARHSSQESIPVVRWPGDGAAARGGADDLG